MQQQEQGNGLIGALAGAAIGSPIGYYANLYRPQHSSPKVNKALTLLTGLGIPITTALLGSTLTD
jgi:hypothetical protein